jgi:hypothetical protein
MSTVEMIVNLSTVIFAGSDTTATGLRTIIYYLCKDLSKMKKVADELDAAERQGVLGNPVAYKELSTTYSISKQSSKKHCAFIPELDCPSSDMSRPVEQRYAASTFPQIPSLEPMPGSFTTTRRSSHSLRSSFLSTGSITTRRSWLTWRNLSLLLALEAEPVLERTYL